MKQECIVGTSDMAEFVPWWEQHLPSYMLLYCIGGRARINLQFAQYALGKGCAVIISPDMFPAFVERSADFAALYCRLDRDFAEETLYGVPSQFFEYQFLQPVVSGGKEIETWMRLLLHVVESYAGFLCHKDIIRGTVHNIYLLYYNLWRQQFKDKKPKRTLKRPERLCMDFYNLMFDHFTRQREIRFYADRLCVTPNYLAMIVRQVSNESPKEAIDRQVVLEMQYMLRNTACTLGEIAQHMSFADTSYMCRYFRKHTGMSMSEYRKTKP